MRPLRLPPGARELMSPREVAESFGVDPKTVTRWANDGRLATVRTPGGHRRYDAEQVREIAARGG